MEHDKPGRSLLPQEKKGLLLSPSFDEIGYAKEFEKKVNLLTTQFNNFRMGTAFVAIITLNAFTFSSLGGFQALIMLVTELVFLLFIAQVLGIPYITSYLDLLLNKALSLPEQGRERTGMSRGEGSIK